MVPRKRKPLSVASRMAWNLVLLFAFTLTLAHFLGLVPDPDQNELRRRAVINETLAITSSLLAQHGEEQLLEKNFATIVSRYPDVLSSCIRRSDGSILHQIGDHARHWKLKSGEASTRENTYVPVTSGSDPWGTVEFCFAEQQGLMHLLGWQPIIPLGIFLVCLNGVVIRWYLLRAFTYLDPTKSVPMHVRSTLDTFSEGVVVLDNDRRIVLANDKFKRQTGRTDQEILGQGVDRLPWDDESAVLQADCWETTDSATAAGVRLGMQLDRERRTYLVNASPILGSDGKKKGTIASFDDITPLEQKREELSKMLRDLQLSRDELTLRNEELHYLATRDPLTSCLNRRTFFEIFDKQWNESRRHDQPLCCFMVDVDHFKSVNDDHGHSAGDEVLRRVAAAIQNAARKSDVVCRYGGEEFCMLLPQTDIDQACRAAERIRTAIADLQFKNLSVTVSLGVSSITLKASDPQELLDQADQCLYIAKRNGRNQVVRWDNPPPGVPENSGGSCRADNHETNSSKLRDTGAARGEQESSIPYPAVASLVSALAYRDAATAMHSTRVAELCVATASGLLSVKETYVLEVAALLHDIGKIGVPDAILLKPGPLTREEWETMELHDRIGVEIVEASFCNRDLVDIVRYHHATYGGSPDAPHFPAGEEIPIGARIVTIADAYDAMVSDRVYRKGRPAAAAFEELRRCAGRQFDPQLVERFIAIAKNHKALAAPVASKQTALQIGLQIERLARAIDERDQTAIKALASRLESTAAAGGNSEIEAVAAQIKGAVGEDDDLLGLLQMVEHLLTLCRSAHKVYADIQLRTPANGG